MNFGKIGEFFLGKGKSGASNADSQQLREADELVAQFLVECQQAGNVTSDHNVSKLLAPYLDDNSGSKAFVIEAAIGRAILLDNQLGEFRKRCRDPRNPHRDKGWAALRNPREQLRVLVTRGLGKKLLLNKRQLEKLISWGLAQPYLHQEYFPVNEFVKAVENYHKEAGNSLEEDLKEPLVGFAAKLDVYQVDESVRKPARRLRELLSVGRRLVIGKGELWTDFAIAKLDDLSAENRDNWYELLELCAEAGSGKPTAKWSLRVRELVVEKIGVIEFHSMVLSWLPYVDQFTVEPKSGPLDFRSLAEVFSINENVLRGLIFACEFAASPEMSRGLTSLALLSYRKVPGAGPSMPKIGNACILVLGKAGDLDAVGQLALLKVKVKFIPAQKMIEKALTESASKQGLPRDEIEEMSVPDYGLDEVGGVTMPIGDASAEVRVLDSSSVQVQWRNSQGKPLKSAPAALKSQHAEEIKELKLMQTDIEKMLSAQAARIDSLSLDDKSWDPSVWRERYLNHPLVGVIARRLIWKLEIADSWIPALWDGDAMKAVDGESLAAAHITRVALWHPLDSSTQEVSAWRERVESLHIKQPFKQAHREVYILTPAEESTNVYSNRFAGHILKQHQFNALCGQRGWRNKLRLMVDDDYPPAHRELKHWGLRAEFWIEGLGSEYGTDTNEAGSFLYLSTDQVRFYRQNAPTRFAHAGGGGYHLNRDQDDEPMPLSEIPKKVFSEVMRDVDLFVGVCSVGNDPNWTDGGRETRYQEYWSSYSFGELSGSAANRKGILERLVPKLKIGPKCRFSDKFLIVQGTLREYKIHLGSGNILMSPNDQYLCIVQKQSVAKKEDVFLPFEGDRTLSLILSKAFLLAADDKITDKTILAQIK